MGTRHLAFSVSLPSQTLALSSAETRLEIEVPAGESHFKIQPNDFSGENKEYVFHLRHDESRLLITGLVEARATDSPQLKTTVIHRQPNTYAETLIRTLAYDNAQPRYEGIIQIEKKAHNCESYLNHHSLLLSDQAHSWTLPSLEILADQVKCSHAATIRTITELDLFYLRSRGISSKEAEEILIKAFVSDVV